MKKVHVIGKLSEVIECQNTFPKFKYSDIDILLNSRKFIRWYKHNARVINACALATPIVALSALNAVAPGFTLYNIVNPPAVAVATGGTVVKANFLGDKGAILLHMLIIGFVTLIVSSFLKFTGRGDFIPLVMFVTGGIILYEVIGLFRDIYTGIATMLNM